MKREFFRQSLTAGDGAGRVLSMSINRQLTNSVEHMARWVGLGGDQWKIHQVFSWVEDEWFYVVINEETLEEKCYIDRGVEIEEVSDDYETPTMSVKDKVSTSS